jgi:hypothetical protein
MRSTPFWWQEELTTQNMLPSEKSNFCAPLTMCPSSANLPQAVKIPLPVHLVPFQVPSAAASRTSQHRRLDPRTPGDVAASCATLSCGGTRNAATHHTTREMTVWLMSAILEKAVLLVKSPRLGPSVFLVSATGRWR